MKDAFDFYLYTYFKILITLCWIQAKSVWNFCLFVLQKTKPFLWNISWAGFVGLCFRFMKPGASIIHDIGMAES